MQPLTDIVIRQIEKSAEKGLNEEEIAKSAGIKYPTFRNYKADGHPYSQQILSAIKKGRDAGADKNIKSVENALFKKATGWDSVETRVEKKRIKQKNGSYRLVIIKETTVTKTQAPSDLAIMYFLGNRDPEHWRSINRAEPTAEDNRGEILEAINKMLED